MLKNEKGFQLLQILLAVPFCLYFFLCVFTSIDVYVSKNLINRAAREAQRELSIHHDVTAARQKAVNIMNGFLSTSTLSVPGVSVPHQCFDPVNPNNADGLPDVFFTDDGSSQTEAHVRYHVITLAPGMARLLNPGAPLMSLYINLESVDNGHREYVPQ